MRKIVVALVFMCYGLAAQAAVLLGGPSPGLWWNPNESGRGIAIDLQDGIMVVTTYAYTPQGPATWFISAGSYNFTTNTFSANFDGASDGQCFGCPYKQPVASAGVGGPMKIVFDSYTTGTLYFNGGTSRIQRQLFGYTDKLSMMRGSFLLSFNASGLALADWLEFDTYTQNSNGRFVAGNYIGFPTTRVAVGSIFDSGESAFLVRVGDFYDLFLMNLDDKRLWGRGWTYRVGGSPTGGGSPAYGVRIETPKEVGATGSAAVAASGQDDKQGLVSTEREHAAAKAAAEGAAPPHILELARSLEQQMQ